MIYVTKTFLPDQEAYQKTLKRAWDKGWITNRGTLVCELEATLRETLKTNPLVATTNGTLPIQIAIKVLANGGEVITTPFSYVATTSSIVWENCTPVFVDIDANHLTIDPAKIEAAITSKTTAILATHVFGNPCDVYAIQTIAKQYNLKVIYDAAHCFGVKYQGQSIFNFGDVSTCSFHATKIFHTGEGGAMFINDESLYETLFFHHNFGHDGPGSFRGLGVNAKMSELQAAMGLAMMPHMEHIFNARKNIVKYYENAFVDEEVSLMTLRVGTDWNYCYFPLIFKNEIQALKIKNALESEGVFPRRYFYPSLNTMDYVTYQSCPVSERIANSILCLPLYVGLKNKEVDLIINVIKKELT